MLLKHSAPSPTGRALVRLGVSMSPVATPLRLELGADGGI